MEKLLTGHHRITEKDLERFTLKGHELYFDNQLIVCKTKLGLWPKVAIGVVAFLGVLANISTIANNANAVNNTLCFLYIGPCATGGKAGASPSGASSATAPSSKEVAPSPPVDSAKQPLQPAVLPDPQPAASAPELGKSPPKP
ncbi:hypothetical protein M2352_003476 [Azospirillum fermentarium]|uniref:hypothetical protein n=1 Tax=Azospirillum fermentarium TaxID=1233114 RepID=UPI002226BD14|nr:hypothetical protein [Azospirillum fermentarium]MCW2247842.1 hypothetical protein [Azospirillum fermentarium]